MDQEIRNKLRNVVTQCRKLLEDSVSQELEGKYGIFAKKDQVTADPNATMVHLTQEEQAGRKDILDHFGHIEARGFKPKEALDQLVREIAFTHLNRLCAYKMMEAREVYIGGQKFREAVSRSINSNGVKFYLADNPEEERLFNTGYQDVAYRHFLDWLGGSLSDEIGVLFNPNDPANRLYPRQKTLDEVLDLLNGGGVKAEETELREEWPKIWSHDETIGWVYQYFTPKELRDQARKESAAPRNSYELAFRNQFFTPRYVVEFLTDNTLGRIWYEMRKGETKLKNQCRYMVRRPTEIFLNEGEQPPEYAAGDWDDLPQKELLKLPAHITHRPKKDPRDLKLLDPACGSGHFLLYCFDLLLTIYEEAYNDPELGPVLQADYPTLPDLMKAAPGLILAHNIHGIDIDQRCTQIAALALWLRCQRAYQEMGLKKDRPKITRSNFVCAEPMPGEEQMLNEFVGQLEPKLLGQLVEVVFDKMNLAGEVGSLLRIEEEIRDAVAIARKQWLAGPISIQQSLFDEIKPVAQQQRFDFSGVTDTQFFEQAEAKVVEALSAYSEKAQNGQRLQRRLFTEDAVRGFAFVDLCHKRFDVVLMNPPFGDGSKLAKAAIEKYYPRTKNDLYAAFVEQGLHRLTSSGLLGAITSRTGFFLSSFQSWREEILLNNAPPCVFADLGYGVLDTAMVETAAYCLANPSNGRPCVFFRVLQPEFKDSGLVKAIASVVADDVTPDVFIVSPASFRKVPGSPFAYWVSSRFRRLFTELAHFENEDRIVRAGLQTSDDFRFLRCWWEVSSDQLLGRTDAPQQKDTAEFQSWVSQSTRQGQRWVSFAKGGTLSPFYCDLPLVIDWQDDGTALKEWSNLVNLGKGWSRNIRSIEQYFKPGLTWPLRASSFSPAALPAGTIFSIRGYAILASEQQLAALCAFCNSSVFDYLFKMMLGRFGFPEFVVGVLQQLPLPALEPIMARLQTLFTEMYKEYSFTWRNDETSRNFSECLFTPTLSENIEASVELCNSALQNNRKRTFCYRDEIDRLALLAYGLQDSDILMSSSDSNGVGDNEPLADGGGDVLTDELGALFPAGFSSYVISICFGVVCGRWDLNQVMSMDGTSYSMEPFAPLPACPPLLLVSRSSPIDRSPNDHIFGAVSDGILADDLERQDDIVRRVRDVLDVMWKGRSDAIEKEVCNILEVSELRDYFRKSGKGGFWDDHLSRYSKSRRKAPIYWLLQSSKKSYALWLYYHRLDKDLLFKALVNYVEPKIRLEISRLDTLRSQKTAAGETSKDSKRLAKEVEQQEDFVSELRDFEDKLRRAANLHLEPDLNDGVVLNIAPLHELVPWKEAKSYWEELIEGKYEWSSIGKQLCQKGLVKQCPQ